MSQPPLLPEETLARVTRLARFDGLMIVAFAGVFAIMSAVNGVTVAAAIGLVAAAAGAIELHGEGLLRHGEPRGITWLILSQPVLLFAILVYCAARLWYFPLPPIPDEMEPMLRLSAEQWGSSLETHVRFLNTLTCALLAGVSFVYQGWMTYYYFTRRHAVERALGADV